MLQELRTYLAFSKFRDAVIKFKGVRSMVNWKTTVSAFVTLIGAILKIFKIDLPPEVADAMITLGIFFGLFFAKDNDVTGGTKQNSK